MGRYIPRLYTDEDFSAGTSLVLPADQSHYLSAVMRCRVGDMVLIFNGRDGEWTSKVTGISRKKVTITLQEQHRSQNQPQPLTLIFPPIKNWEILIEKASELGATDFYPVTMDQSSKSSFNDTKALKRAIEASEQSNRLSISTFHTLQPLKELLKSWNKNHPIFVCDERDSDTPIHQALQNIAPDMPVTILIGPEGGFSEHEFKMMEGLAFVTFVNLGQNILRSETAGIVALGVAMCHQVRY